MSLFDQIVLPDSLPYLITGLPGGSRAFFAVLWKRRFKQPLVVVTQDDVEAESLTGDVEAWAGLLREGDRPAILYFPETDEPGRIAALGRWVKNPAGILVCSEATLDRPVLSAAELSTQQLELRPGQSYPRSKLLEKLAQGGYTRTEMVEMEGETAVRGEVVDLWPASAEKPWRLLFDGDVLESLREFNPGLQRSESYLGPQIMLPMKSDQAKGSLLDHIAETAGWLWDEVDPRPVSNKAVASMSYRGLPPPGAMDLGFRSTGGLAGNLARSAAEAKQMKVSGGQVIFFSTNSGESERLAELLEEQLGAQATEGMEFVVGPLRSGFLWNQEPAVLALTNSEIFGRSHRRPRLLKFQGGTPLKEVQDIKPGHYVVHQHYGIGRYKGLELVRAGGQEAEYLKLEYAKGDRLFVPLTDFKQVQKYSGSEGKAPRLNSLDTATWENVKARVKENVQALAKDLLKVHAARAALPGHAYPPDGHLEQEFGASFPYQETADQIRAIADVKRDMEASRPMDRLILGDVGYGKTEVAMRATFKAVVDSKQVAVLVPTTILAEQHYRTFKERFADYPARIGMLSRFQTPKEEKDVLLGITNGTIDIAIGTHRLFQKDVVFKDLGLLIIDEEHRFGVKHKEQLKKIRRHLDLLTMTATPIPRTLSFAMSGMRDLSIIETPPTGRLPISTQVGPYDEDVIKAAIENELARNGQVFYVHNRVQSLATRLHFLQRLMPGLSIGVVHGQMSGPAIEKVMWEFTHRTHQLLLATTIIESGIDIPTVNTLIVEEAEEFGLAQLYQLRGRVGRERLKAYCYLFYSPSVPLTADARARLEALREFTELGSGYRLAMRDMEIRGAGNLLGQEQHGFIAAVGLDLYAQLLQDEMARLKGEKPVEETRFPNLDLAVHAYLPADYLPSDELRILFYKKLVSAETRPILDAVQAELEDRFGPPPEEARILLEVSQLRVSARDLGISAIVQKPSSLDIQFLANTRVNPSILLNLGKERPQMRFRPGPPFTIQVQASGFENSGSIPYLRDLFAVLRNNLV